MVNDERFFVSGWEDDLNDVEEETKPHETPSKEILWAAENGKLELVQQLIESDQSLLAVVDSDGYTPLHRACYGNHRLVVAYLLANGADVSAKTNLSWQPLHSACQWSSKECVVLLLQNGADVNATTEGGQTPLHIAASHGTSYDTVQLLFMHPYIKPGITNNNNETAYDIAKRSSKYYHIFEMAMPALQGIQD